LGGGCVWDMGNESPAKKAGDGMLHIIPSTTRSLDRPGRREETRLLRPSRNAVDRTNRTKCERARPPHLPSDTKPVDARGHAKVSPPATHRSFSLTPLTPPTPPSLVGRGRKGRRGGVIAADLSERGGPPCLRAREGGVESSALLQAAGTPNAVIQELGRALACRPPHAGLVCLSPSFPPRFTRSKRWNDSCQNMHAFRPPEMTVR
jgi:hypothetical protein